MGLEKYTGTIEKEVLSKWLDKKELIGAELNFQILSVSKLDKDMVLELLPEENKGQPVLLRIPSLMKNELIDHFGNNPNLWTGQGICLRFDKFTPKEGSSISEGVKTSLVWTETIDMN